MEASSTAPLFSVLAIPKETANTTRPTASSSATTGSRRFVRGPFALYCRTTISVAAGAVAAAMAPSVMACAADSLSGRAKCRRSRAKSTNRVAVSACTTPTTKACLPVCFRLSSRNSLPIAKAMKPSAISDTRDSDSTASMEVKPSPSMRRAPRQYGPISTPATR